MRRECREHLFRHWIQRKPLLSDPCMHHGTCVTYVPWCMSGSLTRGGGKNVPGFPGACAIHNFTYPVRGPCGKLYLVSWKRRWWWTVVQTDERTDTLCKMDCDTTKQIRFWYLLICKIWYVNQNINLLHPMLDLVQLLDLGWCNNDNSKIMCMAIQPSVTCIFHESGQSKLKPSRSSAQCPCNICKEPLAIACLKALKGSFRKFIYVRSHCRLLQMSIIGVLNEVASILSNPSMASFKPCPLSIGWLVHSIMLLLNGLTVRDESSQVMFYYIT